MPRRSIWKGSFLDAFLLRMKKKRDLLFRRNSLIAPYEFTMEKLLFVVRSLKERLVINLESLLLHGNEDLREQILDREEKRGKSDVVAHMARKGNPISYSLCFDSIIKFIVK